MISITSQCRAGAKGAAGPELGAAAAGAGSGDRVWGSAVLAHHPQVLACTRRAATLFSSSQLTSARATLIRISSLIWLLLTLRIAWRAPKKGFSTHFCQVPHGPPGRAAAGHRRAPAQPGGHARAASGAAGRAALGAARARRQGSAEVRGRRVAARRPPPPLPVRHPGEGPD